jgi:deoxyribonuclease V
MMARELHGWELTPNEAVALQAELRRRLVLKGGPRKCRLVAGADVSFEGAAGEVFAAVVVLDLQRMEVVEEATARSRVNFPYIPGLLGFREVPVLLRAFEKISNHPDAVIFDGQGIAHPRRFGLACHAGLWLDIPSVGCAKSLLVGEHRDPGLRRGCSAPLVHSGQTVGRVARTRTGVRPVFVSQGHRIGLDAAVKLVLRSCDGFRLPEPTRLAHILVTRTAKSR